MFQILTAGEDGYICTWSVEELMWVQPEFDGEVIFTKPLSRYQICPNTSIKHMVQLHLSDPKKDEAKKDEANIKPDAIDSSMSIW